MIKEGEREVNRILSTVLLICAGALITLILLVIMGIFNFSPRILRIIIIAGIPTTLFPKILYKLKVSDGFLKYYMLIMLSIFIGSLGTQTGIGIYITYIVVPLASCLYFSKRFTMYIGIISYFTMFIGVYHNTENKLEVIYKGWSHGITFRN